MYNGDMKPWRFLVVLLIVILLGLGIWRLIEERSDLMSEVGGLQKTADGLRQENESLESQIEYYQAPGNLLKALKSQFNYKEEGEKLIIVVPSQSSSTEATSTTE